MKRQLKGEFPNTPPTGREREVWRLIALDRTHKEIACELGVSKRTISKHVMELHRKLGTRTPIGLALAAVGQGVIYLPAEPTDASLRDLRNHE